MWIKLFALLASLPLLEVAAKCGSGTDECVPDDATSLMQMQKSVTPASERSASKVQEDKKVTFVATVGDHEWYFWFKKADNTPGKPTEPRKEDFPEDSQEDDSDLLSLKNDQLETQKGPFFGPYGYCPGIGLGIPGCRYAAYRNGWRWRYQEYGMCPHLGLGLPGCSPCPDLGLGLPGCSGYWQVPPWRRYYDVYAMLPVDPKAPLQLDAAPKDIALAEDEIEQHMKAANYQLLEGKEHEDVDDGSDEDEGEPVGRTEKQKEVWGARPDDADE